jgi:GT2 family glycosyltransferase
VDAVEVSFCIVNTGQRALLLRGLDAVAREAAALPFATETLVVDNASQDGSAEAARAHPAVDDVIALERRRGKGENDSALLQRARGRYALLLNEDSELLPGATAALHAALEGHPQAGAAGARPAAPRRRAAAVGVALSDRAHRADGRRPAARAQRAEHRARRPARSTGRSRRRCSCAARPAEQIGWFDPRFFVYSDEVDFCKRLQDAGWRVLYVPAAAAIHHEQLSTGGVPERRIVEFNRNRDLYLRLHHGDREARAVRWLTAIPYALRAAAALVLPGHDPRRYARHVTASLRPQRGEGIREAAEAFNARLDAAGPARARTPSPPGTRSG